MYIMNVEKDFHYEDFIPLPQFCNTSKLYHGDYMNEFNYPYKLFIWCEISKKYFNVK